MITLRQLAAIHIDRMVGGDKKTIDRISYQDIIAKIRIILNEILKANIYQRYLEGDKSSGGMCIASYTLPIQNSNEEYPYIELPEFYIELPNNRGIDRIYLLKPKKIGGESRTEITILNTPSSSLQTRTIKYCGLHCCWIEGYKIKFYNIYNDPDNNTKIVINLVVAAPDKIGEDDALPITSDMQNKCLSALMTFNAIYQTDPEKLNLMNK